MPGVTSCSSRHSRTTRHEYDTPRPATKPSQAAAGTSRAIAATTGQPTKRCTPSTTRDRERDGDAERDERTRREEADVRGAMLSRRETGDAGGDGAY